MLQLYVYPGLFGIPDNNPFGLKVDTFLRLSNVPYQLNHTIDASKAPRGQLPYIEDNDVLITDSNQIIDYVTLEYDVHMDDDLSDQQRALYYVITSMLDNHMYWVMSYSRWQDDNNWPLFMAEFLRCVPQAPKDILENARSHNKKKYYLQGIGRYSVSAVYESGVKNLQALETFLGDNQYMFGSSMYGIDVCCYAFLANIYYFKIDTPLKKFIEQSSLQSYIERIRSHLDY